jgi:hypothetical protein
MTLNRVEGPMTGGWKRFGTTHTQRRILIILAMDYSEARHITFATYSLARRNIKSAVFFTIFQNMISN